MTRMIRKIPFFMRAHDQFSADQFNADQFSVDQFSHNQVSATFVAM